MELFTSGKIYICRRPVSWRLGIPGLTLYAEALLDKSIRTSGDWLVFMKRDRHALRALSYQGDRALLFEQRLNSGQFPQYLAETEAPQITREQLQQLFSGEYAGRPIKQLLLS